ncbi:hypothetical protein PEDI_41690 [Persicobacter diffluens]|uniref:Uncharacterized protein n=2 Tax=Persicobacter diffluens TaxID=981 RepID=A0AAN4W3J0_9BACT|nr:hypothetical protein PEDI_41690 [Persicobacter diffluens]
MIFSLMTAPLFAEHLEDYQFLGHKNDLAFYMKAEGKQLEILVKNNCDQQYYFEFDALLKKEQKVVHSYHDIIGLVDAGDQRKISIICEQEYYKDYTRLLLQNLNLSPMREGRIY